MADERIPDAGTPAAPPDDSELAGTPEAGDDSEQETVEQLREKLQSERALALVHKSKAERVNELEAEVARLRAQSDTRTTTDTRDAGADEDEGYIREIEAAAAAGDKASKAFMAGLRRQEALATRTMAELEMVKVPEDRRDSVKAFMAKHGIKSPAVADQLIRGDKYGQLEAEVVELRAKLADKSKSPPAVDRPVRGDVRPAPSKIVNGKEVISLQEYSERMADPARRHETKVARDGGKLTIRA